MKKLYPFSLLAIIMFLQLAIYGSYRPILSTYLTKVLNFSGTQASVIISTTVIAGIFSPLAASFVVDRLIKARHLLSILHFTAAFFSFFTAINTSFKSVLFSYLFYMLLFAPTMGLVNAVTFKNLKSRREHFGSIRVFGTLGWMASGLILGQLYIKFFNGPVSHIFFAASIMGIIISIICFFLPDIPLPPRSRKSIKDIIPASAFKTIARPELLSLTVVFFLSSTMDQFYFFGTGPYLEHLGYSYGNNLAMQTLGQVLEIVSIPVLGFILGGFLINHKGGSFYFKGIGFKKSFLLGLAFQVTRYTIFTLTGSKLGIVTALLCNGFIYTFFYATATIYVDTQCTEENRSGVHQIINMIFFGFSGLTGTITAGFLTDYYSKNGTTDYTMFWMVPTGLSIIALILTVFFIKDVPVKVSTAKSISGTVDDTASGPHETV